MGSRFEVRFEETSNLQKALVFVGSRHLKSAKALVVVGSRLEVRFEETSIGALELQIF